MKPDKETIAKFKRKDELDKVTPKKWYTGPHCTTKDDVHVVRIAGPDDLHWGQCLHCKEKFYIISGTVMKQNGLFPFIRPQLNQN